MENSLKKERYNGIDTLKAICAFLVVCIHAPFSGIAGSYFTDICRLAVPSFFVISGFFYPATIEKGRENRQILRIAKLSIISIACYFVWTYVFYRWTGQDFAYITDRLKSFNGIVKLLVFNNVNFAYHLWYLLAILYVLIMAKIAVKLRLKKLLFCLCPVLLLVGIALSKYSAVVFGKFISIDFSRNCYFFGLPFFCMGWFIGDNYQRIKPKLRKNLLLAAAAIFMLISFAEHFALDELGLNMVGDVYLSTPVSVICLFLYFAVFSKGIPVLSKIGREYSTGIYIIHPAILEILYDIFSKTSLAPAYDKVEAFAAFFVSVFVVWLWRKLRRREVR